MKSRQLDQIMKKQISALLLGVAFSLASTGVSHAMSELISLSQTPLWPTASTPSNSVAYSITTVGRAGAGLLLVNYSTGAMPPGVTVTFSPSFSRFTGNQITAQTTVMTVSFSGCPLPLDSYPFTITATSQRESLTITNQATFAPDYVSVRPATLSIDNLGNSNLCIRGLGATGKTYQIEATTSLDNTVWAAMGSATADGNGRFVLFTQPAPAVRFFRAVTTSGPFVCQ
jgi:hypothetical protein